MNDRTKSINEYDRVFLSIAGFYFIPIFILAFTYHYFGNYVALSLGILFASAGSFVFFLHLKNFQTRLRQLVNFSIQEISENYQGEMQQEKVSLPTEGEESSLQLELNQAHKKMKLFVDDINQKDAEISDCLRSKDLLEREKEKMAQQLHDLQNQQGEVLERNKVLISEYKQTITDQRSIITKRHQEIEDLKARCNDLHYELKTLLEVVDRKEIDEKRNTESKIMFLQDHLEETVREIPMPTEKQIKTSEGAQTVLRRCVNAAQKISGNTIFSTRNVKYRDVPLDNYALDLRRLCDYLRSENTCPVFFYSLKENKILFVNLSISNLVGWNPEKFMQNFPLIIHDGWDDWKRAILSISKEKEVKFRLLIKTKRGDDLLVQCCLGSIPTGVFKNHLIGVFYPV